MSNRREFFSNLAVIGAGTSLLTLPQDSLATPTPFDDNINHIGPKSGFTPQIGTLVSMLDWVSESVIKYHAKLTPEQLDYLHDKDSNTIGSLMMHLAATEVIYQDITFHGLNDFSDANKEKWGVGMKLVLLKG